MTAEEAPALKDGALALWAGDMQKTQAKGMSILRRAEPLKDQTPEGPGAGGGAGNGLETLSVGGSMGPSQAPQGLCPD